MERRSEHRAIGTNIQYPVACVMRHDGRELVAEVLNYHYRGACLRLSQVSSAEMTDILTSRYKVDFFLGRLCLQSDIPYRVCWEDLEKTQTFGIEFTTRQQPMVERADRFLVNTRFPLMVETVDPLDPHRLLMLSAIDVSERGMLLQTSLTNKHIFPGMRLTRAKVAVPGQPPLVVDLNVENARPGSGPGSFLLGVSASTERVAFKQATKNYLTQLASSETTLDEHLTRLADAGMLGNKFKAGMSYKIVSTQEDYDEVLKLRFLGYGHHNKLKPGTTWRDQGEGLDKEGTIVAGYIGGKLICSMEVRFADDGLPMRTEKLIGHRNIKGVDFERTAEVNKLVIHPKAQGSDIVLGMFQRAHAIVINKGSYDVLVATTDKLMRLYEGVGAERTDQRVPHPHLDSEFLTIVVIRRQVYHDGFRFNPHAWNTVYRAVHEHFAQIGMAGARKLKLTDRLKLLVTPAFAKWSAKRKSKKKRIHRAVAEGSAGFVDPKWTKQEFWASVMYPYIVEASDMIGAERVDEILDQVGVPRSYLAKHSNWLSMRFHDVFLDRFEAYGDSLELSKRAGRRTFHREIAGPTYYVLKHLATPNMVFKSFAKMTSKLNRTRTYDVVETGRNRVRVAIGLVSPHFLPKRRESCANWQTGFEEFIRLMTGKPGKVKKLSCCYDGHRTCSYEIAWENNWLKSRDARDLVASVMAALMAGASVIGNGWMAALQLAGAVGFMVAFVAMTLRSMRLKALIDSSTREFEKFQHEAGDRYGELQTAKSRVDEMYREAKVLEQTSRDIQSNERLNDILRAALDAACNNFSFDRAFAMLVDPDKKVLRTAAVAGVTGNDAGTDRLWQYSVDVSARRDNAMVLSSVYHTGNPILIDDIDAHMFQLNEASRALIKEFGSQGFVIVAIPAKLGRWGVIVADKKSKDQTLDRRDLTVLERLGQQLGIALDKRADFEREERLRAHFQKYVPAEIVAQGLSQEAPTLGGESREIIAMFVDIRGFTTLAASLPPTGTVEVLSRFFSILEPIITEHGGTIDKFLGDGALITWGSVGSGGADQLKALGAATALLDGVATLNSGLTKDGYGGIKIGIGLHKGPAIVGNVGSKNRMEFTCIGATVNLAARLEAQCKTLEADIVVSDVFAAALASLNAPGWSAVDGVSVRGLDGNIRVWTFQHHPSIMTVRNKGTAA